MNLRRQLARVIAPPLIAGILAVHVDGCAGYAPDPRSIADPRGAEQPTVLRIGIGTEIEITRRDGVILRGRFHGTSGMSAADYEEHRTEFLSSEPAGDVPAPGAILDIQPRKGPRYAAVLASFTLNGIEVRDSTNSFAIVPYRKIAEVRAEGWKRTDRELIQLLLAGDLPLSTVVRLGVADRDVDVFVDRIARVTTRGGGDAGLAFLIGATGVVLIVVLAAATAKPDCGSIDLPRGILDGFTAIPSFPPSPTGAYFPPRTAMTS